MPGGRSPWGVRYHVGPELFCRRFAAENPMLVPFDTPTLVKAQLDARLEETVALVPWSRRTGIVSLTLELSQLPGFVPVLADPHFSFSHAEREDLRAGYGSTVEWQGFGPDRLADLRARALPAPGPVPLAFRRRVAQKSGAVYRPAVPVANTVRSFRGGRFFR